MLQKISHWIKTLERNSSSFLVPSAPEKQDNIKHVDKLNAACNIQEYSFI